VKDLLVGAVLLGILVLGLNNFAVPRPQEVRPPDPLAAIGEHYRLWDFETVQLGDDVAHYGYLRRGNGKTLLVYIDGSGYRSAFGEREGDRWIQPGMPASFGMSILPEYDLLVPEKLNVTIGGVHDRDPSVIEEYTVEQRVAAAAAVIDSFLEGEDYETVVILGISEGAFIIPKLYRSLRNPDAITSLVLWGAGGLSQYEEFVLLAESDVPMPPEWRAMYEEIESLAEEIQADPESTEKEYFGHPYRRWSSFLWYRPIDDLVEVDIPILILHGALDNNSPVETARYVEAVFADCGKTNLTYYEYAEMPHGPETREQSDRLFGDLRAWLREKESG
jgi:pimeloyl-ACP methyl ester carboxylesterase